MKVVDIYLTKPLCFLDDSSFKDDNDKENTTDEDDEDQICKFVIIPQQPFLTCNKSAADDFENIRLINPFPHETNLQQTSLKTSG